MAKSIAMTAKTETIELDYVTISYKEPVVYLVFKDGAELGFPQIRELTSHAEKLCGNKPYLVFSDTRAKVNVTPEGRKVSADSKEAPLHRGTAVLVKSSMIKIAINFFGGLQKPMYPFRAFTDKKEAIDWLLHRALK